MDHINDPAVRVAVDEKNRAGLFPVAVTFESGIESYHSTSTLDDVWTLARRHNVEETKVLFRGCSRIAIVE